jgi:hypothetical protein
VKGVFTMATIIRSASSAETRSAVLDDAHVGDIRGALGTIPADDFAPRAGLPAKLKTLLAIVGPGLTPARSPPTGSPASTSAPGCCGRCCCSSPCCT